MTPDAADTRRQLFVHWLYAQAPDPDVLQLDVTWTPEFAAAGWLLPLDALSPDTGEFFPAAIEASHWNARLYAAPWFVDVGMLYRRTDIADRQPETFDDLAAAAAAAIAGERTRAGFVWQGARYEGLVTVFLEFLSGFGGQLIDNEGRIAVDSAASIRAVTWMRDAIWKHGVVPPAVLAWQEEQARFAFQNGEAAFMRNWPYAWPLLQDAGTSRVAGQVAISPMPAADGGRPAATLGGSHLAINRYTDDPDGSWALVRFLTAPRQMLERAEVTGQLPARRTLYATEALAAALPMDTAAVRDIIARAIPRPALPIYNELSEILQVALHRALTRQEEPEPALRRAADAMRAAVARSGLDLRTGGPATRATAMSRPGPAKAAIRWEDRR